MHVQDANHSRVFSGNAVENGALGVARLEKQLRSRKKQLVFKRVLDIVIALAVLLVLAPLMILVAIAIWIDSGRPIIFWQTRVGRGGKLFALAKFRSMHIRVDRRLLELQEQAARDGTLLKLARDPRTTRVGAILRATSVDELPQLLNVIHGEMSLVGPRPLIPFMLKGHAEFATARSLVRPGITGLWQISDRQNNTSVDGMIHHDLEYIRDFHLWVDARILLRTIPAVIKGSGAC